MKRSSAAGFSLVEVVIAMSILAVAFFGMIATITYTTRSNESTKERLLAMRAAEKQIETMLGTTFSTIYAKYTGQMYDIDPLVGWPSDIAAGKKVMIVEFPTGVLPGGATGLAETATGKFLDLTDTATGTFQNLDLNGDGLIADTADANTKYKILPVRITIHYKGVLGQQEMIYRHVFLGK